ncbi:cilia- and flagella-associated protein 77-like [Corticium candelabrum]|uniref:cilia- and flagella-associated protein 77-like n=1 Tax=Corticium candelabrum TaxID=121492 RepID=UPI002E26DBFE|nr:cilia- and flagella-associated protein 77-like [Corticium candelabrum]
MNRKRSGNPLLAKPELGKVTTRFFTLPSDDFTYGRRSVGKDGGTAEALSSWAQIAYLQSQDKKAAAQRDFITLNKVAVKNGLTTAQEQFQFRAIHDFRLQSKHSGKRRTRSVPPNITFGTCTRPSTPISSLLENRYQTEWLENRRRAELAQLDEAKKSIASKRYETRASLLRKHSQPVEPPPPWHLPKFSRVPGRLVSFRSPQARETAMKYHAFDGTSRKGMFGQGIYTAATT